MSTSQETSRKDKLHALLNRKRKAEAEVPSTEASTSSNAEDLRKKEKVTEPEKTEQDILVEKVYFLMFGPKQNF